MPVRFSALLITAGAVVALNGCGDPTAIEAAFNNVESNPTVYALSGTTQSAPSAIAIRSASAVAVSPSFGFDLAFDLKQAGEVLIYTVRAIASPLVPVRRVGLQTSADPFDQVLTAPTINYVYDSLLTVPVGRTVLVELFNDPACFGALKGANLRAKLVVDSLDFTKRAIFLHVLSNPNCGFNSLGQGLPKD